MSLLSVLGALLTVFAIGYMLGDMAAMKRADKHRAELRRIREGGPDAR